MTEEEIVTPVVTEEVVAEETAVVKAPAATDADETTDEAEAA